MKNIFSRLQTRIVRVWGFLRRTLFSGITFKWLRGVFGTIFITSVLMVMFFCMFAQNSYYNMVRERLRADAQNLENYYSKYVSTDSFATAAQLMVENFEDTALMELQIYDTDFSTAFSSSGFPLSDMQETDDIINAREGRSGYWTGPHAATGEKIMSYSVPLTDSYGNIQGTLRLLTSLEMTDHYLMQMYLVAIAIGLCVILLTGFSGFYFIKSIVVPITQINDIAHAIAGGNMTQRIEKYDKDDELGKLCAAINDMARELGESEKVKNDFISSVSHELRTPLTAIRGWSETMIATQSEDLDPTTRRGIEVIYKETERLSKLVEELLDSSRIQNGRFKLMVAPMDVVAEFEDTVFMMMERARLENVTIEYEPGPDSVEILGDKNRLKQVFFNIIDNSIKHSHTEGKIETAITLYDGEVRLTIADHGEGISAKDLPFVKQMFYKGHSQKRGSGIGLGVADEIVKKHSGKLDIQSEEGHGTTVTISLPLKEQEP